MASETIATDTADSEKQSWQDRLLCFAGIEPGIYRVLLSSLLLMDFRNQHFGRATATGGAKEILTPLFTVTGQNLLIGLFASVAMFTRVDVYFFALAALAVTIVVTTSSVIVEFNEIVLDPDDWQIIGHLPFPLRTYAAARVTNLLAYLLLTIASLSFFPMIIGVGLRDSGWWFLPLFAIVSLTTNLVISAIVIMAYNGLLGSYPSNQLRERLAWVQVGAMLVLGYGAQLVIRDPRQSMQVIAYQLPDWVRFSPPGWMAFVVTGGDWAADHWRWTCLAGAILLTFWLWNRAIAMLAVSYSSLESGRSHGERAELPPLARPGELTFGWMTNWITRAGEERLGYWLCHTFLQRDYNLKMRCWTTLGVVIAALAMGYLTGKLVDPLTAERQDRVFAIVCIYLLAMPLPQILYNLNFSKDYQASWLLSVSPITDVAGFASGLRRAVLIRFMVPLLGLYLITFWLLWGNLLHSAIHVLIAALIVVGTAHVCSVGCVRAVPFSAPLARGESFGAIAPFASAVGSVITALGTLHFFALDVAGGFAAYVFGLGLVVVIVCTVTRRMLLRRVVTKIVD